MANEERHLDREVVSVADSQQLNDEVRSSLEDTSALTGERLFRSLVRHIASAFHVRHAFVAEWTDDASGGEGAMVKGGSFALPRYRAIISSSGRRRADIPFRDVGFRCARDLR